MIERFKDQLSVYYKVEGTETYITITCHLHMIDCSPIFSFVIRDVTSFHDLEKLKEFKKKDLLQLASIVHDLKTPLNCIQMTSWIIQD
jgi:hypothetical protein